MKVQHMLQAAQKAVLKKLGKMRQQSLAQGTAGHGTTGLFFFLITLKPRVA